MCTSFKSKGNVNILIVTCEKSIILSIIHLRILTSRLLTGLSSVASQWNVLPSYLTRSLLKSLEITLPKMKEMEVSNSISGLGRLGVEWNRLSSSVKRLLFENLLRTSNDQNSKGLAMTIHGLGKMGAESKDIPNEVKYFISTNIVKFCESLNAIEVSNIVYGLGKLESNIMDVSSSSVQARNCLFDAIQRESWRFTSQGVSNTMWGLMLLKVQWVDLPDDLTNGLLMSIAREANKMSEQELGNTIYAAGKIGVLWDDCSKDVKLEILKSLEDHCINMSSASVVMVLLGLGRLKVCWNELPFTVTTAICDASARVIQIAKDESISILVHALASSGCVWDKLGPKLQTAIEESISRSHWSLMLSSSPLSNTTWLNDKTSSGKVSLNTRDITVNKGLFKMQNNLNDMVSNHLNDQTKKSNIPVVNLDKIKNIKFFEVKSRRNNDVGMSYKDNDNLLRKVQSSTLDRFLTSHSEATPTHYHHVHSLGLLGAHWDHLGFSTRTALLSGILNSIDSMDERAVVNIFQGLANLHVKWSDLRDDVKRKLYQGIVRVSTDIFEQGLSVLILSLAKLEICWQDDLPDIVKACLRRAIAKQSYLGE